jgi:serine/threonine protein kinase
MARDWSGQSRNATIGKSGAYTLGYATPEVLNKEPRNSSADVWSLGCIYLDMAVQHISNQGGLEADKYGQTVFKGETLASKSQFFTERGTGEANPRSNPKAFELGMAHGAKFGIRQTATILEWIKQTIRNAPNERITTAGLMDWIHTCEDDHVYYNSCCNGKDENEGEMSYHGSSFE